jgi:hypothetical protein
VKRALPYLLYGVVTLVCFWKFLFLGWTLYDVRTLEGRLGIPSKEEAGWFESHRPSSDRGDTVLSLPMLHRLYGEGLHHGELRLWNPYLFCGYPIYNNLLLHPFYPPNLVLHALIPPRTAYDLNLLIHFFFSGAAMFWLLRGSGRSDFAAWVGGLLWMLIGYNTFWFSTGTFMGASVFAPLALLGLRRGLETQALRPLALGGLAMGMVILGSHGQHALHVLIFLSLWLLVVWIADRDARRFILKGGVLFLGCALGSGMAAILTQMDSVTNGFRVPGGDFELHYSMPWMLPTYVANVALGKVCFAPDGLLRSEFTIYAGIAGTALAVAGAIRGFGDRWIRFLSIVAIAALAVAFIRPLAQIAAHIPFLNLSMPARWVYVFGFCLTMLAANGVDAMAGDRVRSSRVAAGVIGLSLLSTVFFAEHGALAETLIGGCLAVTWMLATWKAPRLAPGLCVAALAFDLIPSFVCFNAHADPAVLDHKFGALEFIRDRERDPWRAMGTPRDARATENRLNGWILSTGSNLLALYGAEAEMGYESIAPITTVDYCVATSGIDSVMGSGRVLAVGNPQSKLMAMANLKYLALPFLLQWDDPHFKQVGLWGAQQLLENTAALPRAYLVSKSIAVSSPAEANQILKGESFDPRTTAVLEFPGTPRTSQGGGTVAWVSRETDRIELAVEAKGDSLLVVSDTDYPGWEATVDGAETRIMRANLTFRAVRVPAGSHKVVMRFRPGSARIGLILSSLTVVAVLVLLRVRKTI